MIASLIFLAFLQALPTLAAQEHCGEAGDAFSLRWENDSFDDTDENYTNGLSLALTRRGEGPLGGVWGLFGAPAGKRFATYELTQLQFTPTDLKRSDPDPGDRPYAGVLYLGFTTHLQREESLQSLKLIAGVVGPASYSEEFQKFTHNVIGANLAQGWNRQLKNEPVVNLLYDYRRRYLLTSPDSAVGVELIPVAGASLGNYLTEAQAEVQCRIGYHLPDDFGATTLRGVAYLPFPQAIGSPKAWGIYAFAGGGANLVARNLALDGNTFARSRSVDKRPFLPGAQFGATLWTRLFQASFSYVIWGKEFYGQKESQAFGSVLLSYFF